MSQQKYATQWAAQFCVAGELSRRGYRVSLTLGNAKSADLVVRSPGGALFDLEVKGLAASNFWLLREDDPRDDLFFALVLVPRGQPHDSELAPARFFLATSAQVMAGVAAIRERSVAKNAEWKESGSGLNWSDALPFEANWAALPK